MSGHCSVGVEMKQKGKGGQEDKEDVSHVRSFLGSTGFVWDDCACLCLHLLCYLL